jgi:hypothetical protein
MKTETIKPSHETEVKVSKDYSHSSPEDILRDIERTKEHMDRSLSQLGEKLIPRLPRRTLRIAGAVLLAAGLGLAGYLGYRYFKPKPKQRAMRWMKSRVKKASVIDQILLAKNLALAARKGQPSIIVVQK